MFSWISKIFKKKSTAKPQSAPVNPIKVVDRRRDHPPIRPVQIQGDNDPAMQMMLAAAISSNGPVMGSMDGNTLTITDCQDRASYSTSCSDTSSSYSSSDSSSSSSGD